MAQNIAAGNWKMNTSLQEGQDFVNELSKSELPVDVEVILGVPFISIAGLTGISIQIKIAAQNCSQHDAGAYTGETSVSMLKAVGTSHVILGHSERRQYFSESDELILKKTLKSLEVGLKVIYCCGEPLEVREAENEETYVLNQLQDSILKLTSEQMKDVVIAYEPIWAIGTGKTASPEQAQDMHAFIRRTLTEKFGIELAAATSILYGGSVKPANAKEIFSKPDVDGGLVGGASLKTDSFLSIIKSF